MKSFAQHLELQIIESSPKGVSDLTSCGVGPVGRDGRELMVVGGNGGILWYDPDGTDRGYIATGIRCGVGLALEDVDGDGVAEVFVSDINGGTADGLHAVSMFKLDGSGWRKYTVDATIPGNIHDIVFADIDGDGVREMAINSCYSERPGVFILKPTSSYQSSLPLEWTRFSVHEGIFTEGISIGDLDGDGRLEIVSGPDWFTQPKDGPYSGVWQRATYAPTYREMCRTALADITGTGRPDIIITDSEYMDGTLSWYENRLGLDGPQWVEHVLCDRVLYSHSLVARERDDGVDIFVAEMEQGGWDQPYNHDARLLHLLTNDGGKSWTERVLYTGEGTHQAIATFTDRGVTVYGKSLGRTWHNPRVQVWREPRVLPHLTFEHHLIDRDKAGPGTDIVPFQGPDAATKWFACGRWIYSPRTGEKTEVPGVSQIINAFDIDGDGTDELIVTAQAPPDASGKISPFGNELCWVHLDCIEPFEFSVHRIGTGHGDWPHGSLIAQVLADDRYGVIVSYHSANKGELHYPQVFSVPDQADGQEWKVHTLADIRYGEEMAAVDITGDGRLDIVAGNYWLENNGDGTFEPHTIVTDFHAARVAVCDIAGNGRPDVMLVEESVDHKVRVASFARVAWFECPENPLEEPWPMHLVDSIRSPHSLSTADLDGDGVPEFIVAEHDPFWPYRMRNRLFVYKSIDRGRTWYRKTIDSRFEHHDGAKLAQLDGEQWGILSHGWNDQKYVHLWTVQSKAQLEFVNG